MARAQERFLIELLEDRLTPTTWLWNPSPNNLNWNTPVNWAKLNTETQVFEQQLPADTRVPGVGLEAGEDEVILEKVTAARRPGLQANGSLDCVVNVTGGVRIKSLLIGMTHVLDKYLNSLILTNPVTVTHDAWLCAPDAAIRGSAIGQQAFRGDLTVDGGIFEWGSGTIENVTLVVTGTKAGGNPCLLVRGTGQRFQSGSDIIIHGGCDLEWDEGDVTVTDTEAASKIVIERNLQGQNGHFYICPNAGTWGVNHANLFRLQVINRGNVEAMAGSNATLVGNFENYNEVDVLGRLSVEGTSAQYSGRLTLISGGIYDPMDPADLLMVEGGLVEGVGRIQGNLTLETVSSGFSATIKPGTSQALMGDLTIQKSIHMRYNGVKTVSHVGSNGQTAEIIVEEGFALVDGEHTVEAIS